MRDGVVATDLGGPVLLKFAELAEVADDLAEHVTDGFPLGGTQAWVEETQCEEFGQ